MNIGQHRPQMTPFQKAGGAQAAQRAGQAGSQHAGTAGLKAAQQRFGAQRSDQEKGATQAALGMQPINFGQQGSSVQASQGIQGLDPSQGTQKTGAANPFQGIGQTESTQGASTKFGSYQSAGLEGIKGNLSQPNMNGGASVPGLGGQFNPVAQRLNISA